MMKHEQQCWFRLYTASRFPDDRPAFDRLWAAMSESFVGAERYDSNESPLQKAFVTDPSEPFALLQKEGRIYVAGSRGFLASAWSSDGIDTIQVYLDQAELASDRGSAWIDWFLRLSGQSQLLYGLGCSTQEHDAKHRVIRELPNGGQVKSAVGVSKAEFRKYLPGIYWLTLFGEVLAARLPFDNLASLPVITTPVGNGAMAVQIDEPVVPHAMAARLALEAKIADALGATLFFDRNRTDVRFEHLPELRAELDLLT